MPNTNNFYMAGNMGGALSLGIGSSLAGKKVIVCGGDAEFVMHMGGLTTAGRYSEEIDLTYILFDNESNKSTGGQNSYQNHLDYINIAKASGLEIYENIITSLDEFNDAIDTLTKEKGLKFFHIKCGIDEETPRPPIEVVKVNRL
jgi:phosphonopyruvate decarboxylase